MAAARLTPEQVKQMVRMRRYGARPAEIARKFGVSQTAVDYRLRTVPARLLDCDGKLHELRGRLPARILAVVWLRDKKELPRKGMTADDAGGRAGSEPEGSSGAAAVRVQDPANSDQLRQELARAATETPPLPRAPRRLTLPPPPAAGRAIAVDDVAIDRVRKPVDMGRFRQALADKAAQAEAERKTPPPTERASSREECTRCGVPGFKGCAHQLPYEAPPPETKPFDYRNAIHREAYARRHGNQRKQSA